MIPALTKTEKTKLAGIILGEISPSAVLFIILSRPQNTKELVALLGPFIPGDTLREKVAYAFTVTRPAFDSDARFREVAFGVLEKLRGVTDDEGEPVEVDGEAPASGITGQERGDIDLSTAVWHGPNGSKAKVTETLSNLKIDSKQISYSISKGTDSWEPHTGAKNVNQYSCFFVFRDGRFQGGKFDWSTYSRKTRPLDNIKTGYTGGIVPRTGEDVWFCFMDLGGTKRTNCEKVKWP